MPTQNYLRLDQLHDGSSRRCRQQADDPPLTGRPADLFASQATLRRHQLLSEDFVLRDEGSARAEHAKHEPPKGAKHSD